MAVRRTKSRRDVLNQKKRLQEELQRQLSSTRSNKRKAQLIRRFDSVGNTANRYDRNMRNTRSSIIGTRKTDEALTREHLMGTHVAPDGSDSKKNWEKVMNRQYSRNTYMGISNG